MKRNVSLAEISDGRLYKASDMVKADCGGCNGCSRCCHGMGNSIILDPYDVYRMTTGMGKSMQELLAASVELNVVDGVILPNLKMQGTKEACAYLDSITFGRLKCGAPVDDTVKLAACALADVAARYQAAKADERSRPGLASFNTDGYSETLNTAVLTAQYTADMQAAADIYLPRSHPLRYAGRDGGGAALVRL